MAVEHVGYRFRSDDSVGLNTDSGWAAAVNTVATTIGADVPFRLRVELAASATTTVPTGTLQYRVDKAGGTSYGAWTTVRNNATYNQSGSASGHTTAMAIPSAQYTDLAATTNLLTQAGTTFVAGSGSHDNSVPVVTGTDPFHTEHEFCIILRKLSEDGHVPDGSRFQFRYLTSAAGETFTVIAEMTVANRPGHIGGSTVETMARPLVETAEGVLYTLTEFADTNVAASTFSNHGVMMKSADDGASWTPQDQNNQTERDMESVDLVYQASTHTIHVFLQGGAVDAVKYRKFYTSGHATTPDTWNSTVWETIYTILRNANNQAVSGHVRSDGSMVASYSETESGTLAADRSMWYNIRSTGGTWGTPALVPQTDVKLIGAGFGIHDAGGTGNAADAVHFFYIDPNGAGASTRYVYHRALAGPAHSTNADQLSNRSQVATGMSNSNTYTQMMAPPIIWTDGGTRKIGILFGRNTIGTSPHGFSMHFAWSALPSDAFSGTYTWTVENVNDGGTNVLGAAIGSRTLSAGCISDGSDVHAVWVDQADNDIDMDTRTSGAWGTDSPEFTGTYLTLRTVPVTAGIGVITDSSTGGGTGTYRFDTIALTTGASGSGSPTDTRDTASGTGSSTGAPTVPGAVSNLAGTAGDTQVVLTWTAPADGGAAITDYIVHYRVAGGSNEANPVDPAAATHTIGLAITTANGTGNYAAVQPGDTVALTSGSRSGITLENFHGTPSDPIVFVNDGGIVNISGSGYAAIQLKNCSNIRVSGSGAAGGGGRNVGRDYTEGQQDAGIVCSGYDRVIGGNIYSTWALALPTGNIYINIEIDHIDMSTVSNSAIHAAADQLVSDAYTVYGWHFHHLYIHDVGKNIPDDVAGEGFYLGVTSAGYNGIGGLDVHHCRVARTCRDGIQLSYGTGTGNRIRDNLIYDTSLGALNELAGQETWHALGIIIQFLSTVDVYRNVILRDAYGGINLRSGDCRAFNNVVVDSGQIIPTGSFGIQVTSQAGDRKLWNNTVVGSANRGFNISDGPTSTVCRNNISYGNVGSDYFVDGAATNVTLSHNLSEDGTASTSSTGGHLTLTDPLFVDAASDNYRLAAGSPAINAGTDLSAEFSDDLDRSPRPFSAGWDMGAYERQS